MTLKARAGGPDGISPAESLLGRLVIREAMPAPPSAAPPPPKLAAPAPKQDVAPVGLPALVPFGTGPGGDRGNSRRDRPQGNGASASVTGPVTSGRSGGFGVIRVSVVGLTGVGDGP